MRRFLLLIPALLIFALSSCVKDTFRADTVLTAEDVKPADLKYPTVIFAREKAQIKSGMPTVQTGGVIPQFEIIGGRDGKGNEFDAATMSYISIENATYTDVTVEDTDIVVTLPEYKDAGQITIAAGHPFVAQEKYFIDVRVTAALPTTGEVLSTNFIGVFDFEVVPNLPSANDILFVPLGQNLVSASPQVAKSSVPTILRYSENTTFALTEEDDEIFDIDASTGQLSLDPNFVYTEDITVYPSFVVKNTISGEESIIPGSKNLLTILISNTSKPLPLQTKYFFTPSFGVNDDFKIIKTKEKDSKDLWVSNAKYANHYVVTEYTQIFGEDSKVTFRLVNSHPNGKSAFEHDTWFVLRAQDLSIYEGSFDLKATFWLANEYVEYKEDGSTPSDIEIYYSTTFDDFTNPTAEIDLAEWTNAEDAGIVDFYPVGRNGILAPNAPLDKLPYPGPHTGAAVDGVEKSTALNWEWHASNQTRSITMKCVMDLSSVSAADNFTLAVRMQAEAMEPYVAGKPRGGNYAFGSVYYSATEKPLLP